MMHPSSTKTFIKREPVAMTQTRQVRDAANTLTMKDLFSLPIKCVDTRTQVIRGFAQSVLINVDSHGVVSGR